MAPKRPNGSGNMSDSRGDAAVRQKWKKEKTELRWDKVDSLKKKQEKKKVSIDVISPWLVRTRMDDFY